MSFRCLLMAFESYSLNKSVLSPNDVSLLWPVPNLLVPPAPAIPSALARLSKQGCSVSFPQRSQYCLLQGKTFSVEVRLLKDVDGAWAASKMSEEDASRAGWLGASRDSCVCLRSPFKKSLFFYATLESSILVINSSGHDRAFLCICAVAKALIKASRK